jgi:hypothetical protein
MRRDHNKLKHANAIAAFYIQDEADEALLGLRSVGFRDSQIGYYAPTGAGEIRDFLTPYYRFFSALVWGCLGTACGVLIAGFLIKAGVNLDPWGLAVTSGVFGALFIGLIGGMMGMRSPEPGTFALEPRGVPESYFLAVDAGPARDKALAILRQHGGEEMEPLTTATPAAAR